MFKSKVRGYLKAVRATERPASGGLQREAGGSPFAFISVYRFVAQIKRACNHTHGGACAGGFSYQSPSVAGPFTNRGFQAMVERAGEVAGPQLAPGQRVRCRCALFDSTDVQDSVFEVHLVPTEVNQF